MWIRGVKKTYWERFVHLDGSKEVISLGTSDPKMAQKICEKKRTDILMDKNFGTKLTRKRITVSKMLNNWWDFNCKNWAGSTTRTYEVARKFWEDQFDGLYADSITPQMMEESITFLRTKGVKRSGSKRREPNGDGGVWGKVRLIKKVYEDALTKGLLDSSPFLGKGGQAIVKVPMPTYDRNRYFSEAERNTLFKTLNLPEWRWLRDYTIVASQTGLRRKNMCGMKWKHINLAEKTVCFTKEEMKNKKPFKLTLSDDSFRILKKRYDDYGDLYEFAFLYKDGTPITTSHVSMSRLSTFWGNLMGRLGIKDFRLHDLRHDFGSYLVQSGVDIYVASKLLGHCSVKQTQRYAHLKPAQQNKALKVFKNIHYANAETISTPKDKPLRINRPTNTTPYKLREGRKRS